VGLAASTLSAGLSSLAPGSSLGGEDTPAAPGLLGLVSLATAEFFDVIFFIVLGTQSFVWARLYHRLAAEVRAWPTTWMPESQLAWTKGTALDHWGLFSQVIAVQGREPRVLLWTEEMEAAAHADPPRVAFSPFNSIMPTTLPHDWFHWERLLAALAKEEKSTASSSPNSNVFAR